MNVTHNSALWITRKRGPFAVDSAPMPEPRTGEIVVQTRAIAVNPFERLIQTVGDLITPWIRYPAIVGTDVAGEVVALGSGVTRFAIGDRVIGFAAGAEKGHRSAEGAFQSYVVLLEHMTSPVPASIPLEAASALPLAICTAAARLFESDKLAMSPPSETPARKNETLLVWGGSTSVGCNAIQLAVAAGYDVVATASPANHAYLKKLGARAVIDRCDPYATASVIGAMRGRRTCGAIAIGSGSARACIDALAAASDGRRFVALATPPVSFDDVPAGAGRWRKLVPVLARIVLDNLGLMLRARQRGVRTKFIWGGSPVGNDIGPMIFEHYLPAALAMGRYIPAPEVEVAGDGLTAIPGALERQRRGVSCLKLVVRI